MGSVHLVADDEERTSEEFETKFDRLFNLNFMHDLKVVVVAKKKREEIYCHKMILCARSEYFRGMYQGGFKEADEGTLILDDCSYEAVMWLMKFFYLDQLALGDMDILPDILKISHRYNVLPCLRYIEHFLARRLTIDNVCLVLNISEQYALADLKRVILLCAKSSCRIVSKRSKRLRHLKSLTNRRRPGSSC
jgi:hypothetical protein